MQGDGACQRNLRIACRRHVRPQHDGHIDVDAGGRIPCSLYSGSQYTLGYTGDDIEGFQADLDKYIKENQLSEFVSTQRDGTGFAFDIKAGNKKANMMALLKEVLGTDYPLEQCRITRNRLICSPKPGERLPYQEYFKTI